MSEYERVQAGDIMPGDRVARARTHEFVQVDRVSDGMTSRYLYDAAGRTIARPRKSASWWREVRADA